MFWKNQKSKQKNSGLQDFEVKDSKSDNYTLDSKLELVSSEDEPADPARSREKSNFTVDSGISSNESTIEFNKQYVRHSTLISENANAENRKNENSKITPLKNFQPENNSPTISTTNQYHIKFFYNKESNHTPKIKKYKTVIQKLQPNQNFKISKFSNEFLPIQEFEQQMEIEDVYFLPTLIVLNSKNKEILRIFGNVEMNDLMGKILSVIGC